MNVVGVAGWKNSGKTRLVERLVAELSLRGLSVSTVKHAHHGFDVDRSGTDSFRHRSAGALEVVISSSRRWALMHEVEGNEARLDELLARLSPADIVLVEGFKREPHPKIETRRRDAPGPELADGDPSVIAIAADLPSGGTDLPEFHLDDIPGIAGFIIETFGLEASASRSGQ